jgi:hypothetical protein
MDPRLLIRLWVYAYSEGTGSVRERARWCDFDPAFQWLTRLDEVNDHTLADFGRVGVLMFLGFVPPASRRQIVSCFPPFSLCLLGVLSGNS